MTEDEAIQASIRKWECLCNNELPLRMAIHFCSLCLYTGILQNDCLACPLYVAGHGCLENESIWQRIEHIISEYTLHSYYLSEAENFQHKTELMDLFEEMLENLHGLQKSACTEADSQAK